MTGKNIPRVNVKVQHFIDQIDKIASKDLKIRRKKTDKNDPMNLVVGVLKNLRDEFKSREKNKDRTKNMSLETTKILDSFINHTPAGVAILEGPDFRYVSINKNLADLNGQPVKYHIGKPLIEVLPDAEKNVVPVMKKIMKDGKAVLGREFSITLPKKPDKPIYLMDYLFPIPDKRGKPIGIGAIVVNISERKEAEESLKEREEEYRILFDDSRDAIYMTTRGGKIISFNSSALELFGYEIEELAGLNAAKLYAQPQERSDFQKKIERRGYVKDYEVKLCRKDGTELICLVTSTLRRDKDGILIGYQGRIHDITERKKIEEKLKESEERFRRLSGATFEGIGITRKGRVIEANAQLAKMLGYELAELKDIEVMNIVAPESRDLVLKNLKEGYEKPYEHMAMKKDGTIFPVEIHGNMITYKGKPARVTAIRDLTERKKSEAKVAFQASLLEQVHNGVIAVDVDNKISYWNKYAEEIYQWKREEALGKDIVELLSSEELKSTARKNIADIQDEVHWEGEFDVKRKDGSTIPTFIINTLLKDSNGKNTGILGISTDITERKKAEEELNRSHETLKSIASVQSKFISESTRSEIFEELLGNILKLSESQLGFIGEVRKDSYSKPSLILYVVSHIAWDKVDKKYHEQNYDMSMEFTDLNTLSNRVMKTGKTVISNRRSKFTESWDAPKGFSTLDSYIGIPLFSGNKMVGLVGLANRPGGYNSESINYLDAYLKTTANIVRSYKLYRHRLEAERELKRSQEHLRNFSARIQLVREEERTEVAHEIHDELGQALTALKLDIYSLIRELPDGGEKYSKNVQSIIELVDKTTDTVRRISTELRPGVLDVLGIIPAIEWQSGEFQEKTGIKCGVNTNFQDVKLDKDVSTAVFRIFQEALNNVTRHSNATKVKVRLKQDKNNFDLIISDNGRGITEKEINNPTSFGLMSMRERLYPWRGALTIEGTKSKGTTLKVTVPINE